MAEPQYKNVQWEVSDCGLQAIEGAIVPSKEGTTPRYEISANRLLETTVREGKVLYLWPVHMFEKTWVDPELFIDAYDAALKAQGRGADKEMLNATFAYARKDKTRK